MTTGSGPLAKAALQALCQYSDLKCVVFSKKKKPDLDGKDLENMVFGMLLNLQSIACL